MAVSGVSAAGAYAPSQGPVQTSGQHKHGKHHAQSISDVDAQSSSVATAASKGGAAGSKVDISV
jgi:hypothetical protein